VDGEREDRRELECTANHEFPPETVGVFIPPP
jgi:hypothetical protein